MERQKDWFTGINYYDNYSENQVKIQEMVITQPTEAHLHEQVQLIYIIDGIGIIEINGVEYTISEGCFLCLYMHHFYSIRNIKEPIQCIKVEFYIGLFMHMCWEKHPKNAHDKLVYETCSVVIPKNGDKVKIKSLFLQLVQEHSEKRFEYENLILYITLALHAYHCRLAYENISVEEKKEQSIWKIIEQVMLCTEEKLSLENFAKKEGCTSRVLNQRIKQASGYTFFQLQQAGKISNACALLHFPELSLEYISDLLGFSTIHVFYRVFKQYTGTTPREYQVTFIMNQNMIKSQYSIALRLLQYLHLHFMQDIKVHTLCEEFYLKEYTVKEIFIESFGKDFKEVLCEIRISYACSFLQSTKYTILEVANMCGFNSLSTFQRAFLTYMNQTPKSYRSLTRYNR